MTSYTPLANSTYLDFTSYRMTSAPSVTSAFNISDGELADPSHTVVVALVLPRVTDPSGLLAQDWGTRQQTLQDLTAAERWAQYGANPALYDNLVSELTTEGFTLLGSSENFVSSAESRTIWVAVNSTQFEALFDTELMYSGSNEMLYWNGELSLPSDWSVTGLWLDFDYQIPPTTNLSTGTPVSLSPGAQSLGNMASPPTKLPPQKIAELYHFPLNGEQVETGVVGLIEPGIGTALPGGQTETFQELLTVYLTSIEVSGNGTANVQGDPEYDATSAGERSLDVGVTSAINPNSDLWLYAGAGSILYTAIQNAIWDTPGAPSGTLPGNTTSRAAVTSSSFGEFNSLTPESPFYSAYWNLFLDAAIANQTSVIAAGDGGSSGQFATGLTNVSNTDTQPWNILVGGTSLSTTAAAEADTTLAGIVAAAVAGNLATVWQLVAGGLTTLPSDAGSGQTFAEAIWNWNYVTTQKVIEGIPDSGFLGGYLVNSTGAGGVDGSQETPWYQVAFGVVPVTSDSQHLPGRGFPDVSANAGGNLVYVVPPGDMVDLSLSGGTSAAAPLWASLLTQINAIFQDQQLPNLGYMNDLLYVAAAIAPAAFNDITLGNNTTSFFEPGSYQATNHDGETVNLSPTGYGYAAEWGYDLASGLGTPNGLLLARALTAIAHSEMSYDDILPQVLNSYGAGGWTSAAQQSLLIQTVSPTATIVDVTAGSTSFGLSSSATEAYAWTARLAGQSEQRDFRYELARLFDQSSQGAVGQVTVAAGDAFAVLIDGVTALATTAPLTNQFGFVDFQADTSLVRVARAVAVAETVGAADDQTAVVNIRQNGSDHLEVSFYRVDDFAGAIDGLAPGQAGYDAAAHGRTYQTTTGGTAIDGPGYGHFTQVELANVDSLDLIAMKLVNATQGRTYWAFAQANEVVDGQSVGHIWNYGLNTWGFEDTFGGGDRDYNDLVVNLDFTSAFGQGWLV